MPLQTVNLGTAPDGSDGESHRDAWTKGNANFSVLDGSVPYVAGGAGFTNVLGAVTLDLSAGRSFHHTMTGNITSLAFSNVPDSLVYSTSWTWVLDIDATGGYVFGGPPTVTWIDGSSFSDLDLTANARNIITFWQVGSIVYAAFITNGVLELDDLMFDFQADGTIKVVIRQPCTLDVANAEVDGAGTVTYDKNGSPIVAATTFAVGDTFEVTAVTGQSVSVPRYTT